MSTQRKDQSRSAKLGLQKLWFREATDDAADRIVATGFWSSAARESGDVVLFRAKPTKPDATKSHVAKPAYTVT